MSTALTPGNPRSPPATAARKGVVASEFASPDGLIQRSLVEFRPCATRLRPSCRSLWAVWIETVPNTAIAPVAATAIERARLAGERSSRTPGEGGGAGGRV